MTSVLDPSEVNALLAAADSGRFAAEASPCVFGGRGRSLAPACVQPYDFRGVTKLSNDQCKALEMLHDDFARALSAAISDLLRATVQASPTAVSHTTWGQFTASLPTVTCVGALRVEPPGVTACAEISPSILWPMLQRLLGGTTAGESVSTRVLTKIERRLAISLVEGIAAAMSQACGTASPATFKSRDVQTEWRLLPAPADAEPMVVLHLEMRMARHAGTLGLCLPRSAADPILRAVARSAAATSPPQRGEDLEHLRLSLGRARVDVRAILAHTTIRMSDLLALRPGDIITTDQPTSYPAAVQVQGRTKWLGRPGQIRGKTAVRISEMCSWAVRESQTCGGDGR